MIKVFVKSGSGSCRSALKWLKAYKIPFETVHLKDLKMKELVHILSLTDEGVTQLKTQNRGTNTANSHYIRTLVDESESFDELLDIINENPECFKAPIITDNNKLLIGYNEDEIRAFIPRMTRDVQWQTLTAQ
ncbi:MULTISPECIES: ArsC/Spx/MgsR family protein [unclassified Lactococcus]|uniref:ArsC/Spx/MgsR family protein n=1 Tax=unclassified Lactococcus TaxID=2643510 RepID=UPI0011CA2E26|nr:MULTISPECIES: ArsC/Spx/MgsR family protein [unclassified Lactococcus]MQW23206.1 transcriptional regulator Spx [Lactococcus sp. dk101]TXK44255.1 transcriptional regulator Spx [Lactococcus sp. dk310]TXK49986.1 transcriptional regulator Spx [Lactococcus sp. dk322]